MVSSNDEFWEWRERLFLLRGKYKDTPPGFRSDEEALREWERFIREKEEYAARNRHARRLWPGHISGSTGRIMTLCCFCPARRTSSR